MLLPWNAAAVMAVCLVTFSLFLKRAGGRAGAVEGPVRETGVVLALYALWQWSGGIAITKVAGATADARWVWNFERAVGLTERGKGPEDRAAPPLARAVSQFVLRGRARAGFDHFPDLALFPPSRRLSPVAEHRSIGDRGDARGAAHTGGTSEVDASVRLRRYRPSLR